MATKKRLKKQRARHNGPKTATRKLIKKVAAEMVERNICPDTPLRQTARAVLVDHRHIGDRADAGVDVGVATREIVASKIGELLSKKVSAKEIMELAGLILRLDRQRHRSRVSDQKLMIAGMDNHDADSRVKLATAINNFDSTDSVEARLTAAGRGELGE